MQRLRWLTTKDFRINVGVNGLRLMQIRLECTFFLQFLNFLISSLNLAILILLSPLLCHLVEVLKYIHIVHLQCIQIFLASSPPLHLADMKHLKLLILHLLQLALRHAPAATKPRLLINLRLKSTAFDLLFY